MQFRNLIWLSLALSLSLVSTISFSQNYYEDSYSELKDTLFYPQIDSFLSNQQDDSVIAIADKAFDFYYANGQIDRALYLFNVCSYYPTGYGKEKITMPMMEDKVKFLRGNIDTFNIHYATLLHILAFGNKFIESYEKAGELLQEAIFIYEHKNAPKLHLSSALQSLSTIFLSTQEYWKSYQYAQQSLNICLNDTISTGQFYLNKQHDIASNYITLGLDMEETSQLELAVAFHQKAFDILTDKFPYSINTCVTAVNLSADYFKLENYKQAEIYADIAENYFLQYQNIDWYYMVYDYILRSKSNSLSALKSYENARKVFHSHCNLILKYYGNESSVLASIYNDLASNFVNENKYDSALYYYEKIKNEFPDYTGLKISLAKLYAQKGDYQKAVFYAETSLKEGLSDSVRNYKNVYSKLFNKTLSGFYQTSLLASYHFKEYQISKDTSNLYKCIYYCGVSDTLLNIYRKATLIGADDISISRDYHDMADIGIKASDIAFKLTQNELYANNVLNFVGKSKAFKLNAEVQELGLGKSSDNSSLSHQILLVQKIRKTENELLALSLHPNQTLEDSLNQLLFELRLNAYELSYELQNNSEVENKHSELYELSFKEIQSKLENGEALLSFHIAENDIYAIIIGNDFYKISINVFDKSKVKLIKSYHKALKTTSPDFEKTASELYAFLFPDVFPDMENLNRLIIIPDGILGQIPFEPLINPKNNKFIIEEFAVSYNYSIFLWLNQRSTFKQDPVLSFVGFAPVFSNNDEEIDENYPITYNEESRDVLDIKADRLTLKPLPFSKQEIKEIDKMFHQANKRSKVFLFQSANEKNLKENAQGYSVLHIATHGYLSLTDPEFSGLFFYQENEPEDIVTNDGYIYLNELFTMNFDADLVVLSACKSGAGKVEEGEGVQALPRAFIFGGVPNIMVSLWKVHDKKTKIFMVDFYKHLLNGKSYDQALRFAKIDQINKGELPMDWSGFVLIGR